MENFCEKNNCEDDKFNTMAVKKRTAKRASSTKKTAPKKRVSTPKKATKSKPKRKCYFTAACTEYYGLPDDCYQLQTLRNFRDNVLLKTKIGKEIVSLYYTVAPSIVVKIKKSSNPELEFKNIFNHVNNACSLIEQNKNKEARNCYIEMVNYLIVKYL